MKRSLKSTPFAIPREIMIRGKRWLVLRLSELGDSPRDLHAKMQMRGNYGITHTDVREIHIEDRKKPREEVATFIHELLHACSTNQINAKLEEQFIADVEYALLGALEQLEWRRP